MYNLILTALIYFNGYKQQVSPNIKPNATIQVESVYQNWDKPTPTANENTAIASYYDRSACADREYRKTCKTANGEIFDESVFAFACSSKFNLGAIVRFCNDQNCFIAKCNDRGNFESLGRDFDFTPALFSVFEDTKKGTVKIRYEVLQ